MASKNTLVYIGGHVSAAGGLKNAVQNGQNIGANTIQIFGSSPRQWKVYEHSEADIRDFRDAYKKSGMGPLFLHAPYLINLASPDVVSRQKSEALLTSHFKIAESLGAKGLIFHIGSGKETPKDVAEELVVKSMKKIIATVAGSCLLLIENSAGWGERIGATLGEIGRILNKVDSPRAGAGLDTAHAYESGIIEHFTKEGIKKFSREIDETIGWERLYLLHANDSKTPYNSHHDRHENIGEGYIGKKGFAELSQEKHFRGLPWILEVPGFDGEGPDKKNIDLLRKLSSV